MCNWAIRIEATPGVFTPTGEIFDDGHAADIAQLRAEQQDASVNALAARLDALRAADETRRCFVADYVPPGG
jgi:hypothetical protein